jgi:hypothetical protein
MVGDCSGIEQRRIHRRVAVGCHWSSGGLSDCGVDFNSGTFPADSASFEHGIAINIVNSLARRGCLFFSKIRVFLTDQFSLGARTDGHWILSMLVGGMASIGLSILLIPDVWNLILRSLRSIRTAEMPNA